ncbi:MAG: hypothetical protein KC503_01605 [Myxococcales bacterium]|nr:hypothetical protein [Myxococcales bacterium]
MARHARRWLCLLAALAVAAGVGACKTSKTGGGSASGSGSGSGGGGGNDPGSGWGSGSVVTPSKGECGREKQVVTFKTEDGVKLEGDFYPAGEKKKAAVVLLHMIPPKYNRQSYPQKFIDALTTRGMSVLNLDRRGAGKSGGDAKEAYRGKKGGLDAKAAFNFLAGHPCHIDTKRVVFVGASNGTTTALDFTVAAATDPTVEWPKALVFLTGGTYTENQNQISKHKELLDSIPILFVYSKAERTWSVAQQDNKSTVWQFKEYEGGAHGTKMFGAKPESIDEVAKFIAAAVKSEAYN